jgi:diguanylate cyclase (GGDEF)-like protein
VLDELTRLPNRSALAATVKRAVARVPSSGPSVLFLVDIDRFTIVNEVAGHAAGDELIASVGQALRGAVDRSAEVLRLGGDEFAVVGHGVAPAEAHHVAARLRAAVSAVSVPGLEARLFVTASIGYVVIDGSLHVWELVRRASAARFTAKSRGGDRSRRYSAEGKELDRMTVDAYWAGRVRRALAEEHLALEFQPVLDLRSGVVDHNEVLVRLVNGDGTLVSASDFMPAAERFGLVVDLDLWVVAHSIEYLRHEARLGNRVRLAVNLSAAALGEPAVLDAIAAGIARSGIDPEQLEFEVTETAALHDVHSATTFIDALRRLGCRFALDDFGSGFSSYAYLRDVDTETVKIDGSFIHAMAGDPMTEGLVRSMNDLIHFLGRRTVAEGVEDVATLDILRAMDVDFAQGWYIGHPESRPIVLDHPSWGRRAPGERKGA